MKSKTNLSILNNTGVRINPSIIVGESNGYVSGDILDANAVKELVGGSTSKNDFEDLQTQVDNISDSVDNISDSVNNIQSLISADPSDVDNAIDKFEEIVEFLDNIEPGSELYDIIISHIDNGQSGVIKHVEVMTQSQYDALQAKDPNTMYNIIEA